LGRSQKSVPVYFPSSKPLIPPRPLPPPPFPTKSPGKRIPPSTHNGPPRASRGPRSLAPRPPPLRSVPSPPMIPGLRLAPGLLCERRPLNPFTSVSSGQRVRHTIGFIGEFGKGKIFIFYIDGFFLPRIRAGLNIPPDHFPRVVPRNPDTHGENSSPLHATEGKGGEWATTQGSPVGITPYTLMAPCPADPPLPPPPL